jgi:hypothetical protein
MDVKEAKVHSRRKSWGVAEAKTFCRRIIASVSTS